MIYKAKINGIEREHKNRVALEIIKQFIDKNQAKSYEDFQEIFNKSSFSSSKVIIDETKKNLFVSEKGEKEFKTRYFWRENEKVYIQNKTCYITSEWGSDRDGLGRYFDGLLVFAKNNNIIVVDNESNSFSKEKITALNQSVNTKNIMLYGAPGVGKTHNYKKLISQIEEGKTENEIFKSISENEEVTNQYDNTFQNIKDDKRIEFVTFHQSYSYEDFIEGFRPNESGKIELEDGVFKLLCNRAKNQIKETTLHQIPFDEAYDIFRTQYIENELDKIYSVSNVEISLLDVKEKTIKAQSKKAKDHQYVKKSDLETVVQGLLNSAIEKPSDIKKLDVKKDTISLGGLYYPIAKRIIKIIEETRNIVEDKEKNFYIVIDEINRGNISKIFGELITLIEEDKRAVEDKNDYEVTLPYSKEKFKIPSNLYIIATMNSTDKSIATIDIALRRRFTFLKMRPNPELVKHDDAKQLMKELNQYISKSSLGEDFQLGHSYFMGDGIDLDFIVEYKIKPLLEEYFYSDDKSPDDIMRLAKEEYKTQEEN